MDGNICVFGASSNDISEDCLRAAYEVGRLIASSGFGLVFGAGGTGVMGMAARGCASLGGRITGIIPEKLNKRGIYYRDCTEKIVTATMHERKAMMESLASGFIVLPGGFGTMEEFMEVLTLKQLGYFDKAIVLLNVGGFFDPLISQLEKCVREGFAGEDHSLIYHVASTPEEAVSFCAGYSGGKVSDKLSRILGENNG